MKTAFINLLFFYFSRANQIYAHEEIDQDSECQPLSKCAHPSAHPPAPKVALPGMVSWIYRVRVRVCPWPIVITFHFPNSLLIQQQHPPPCSPPQFNTISSPSPAPLQIWWATRSSSPLHAHSQRTSWQHIHLQSNLGPLPSKGFHWRYIINTSCNS